jgi:hypothetical protein
MAATEPDTPVCGQTANRVPVLERKHLARVTPLCSPLVATIRSSNESARRRPGYGWPLHSAQLSSGTLCFDQLSKRDIDTKPRLVAGLVRRSNLNGSPGWAHGATRFLLASGVFGKLDQLSWPRKSPTKQQVARQHNPEPPQPTLFELSRQKRSQVRRSRCKATSSSTFRPTW